MFLTADELVELTGYKRPADQRKWLERRQYPFAEDARGRPKVLRSCLERRLGGTVERPKDPELHL